MKSDDIDRIIEGMTTNKNSLRQAAEMALKYFEDAYGLEDAEVVIKEALRQALDDKSELEWVGLTDDEIAKYWGDSFAGNTQYVQKFARIIEAKLKEKNT